MKILGTILIMTFFFVNNAIAISAIIPNNKPSIQTDSLKCDWVVMTNGVEMRVRVFEITSDEVKYKKCSQNDVIYSVKKEEVVLIKYFDGTKESFVKETDTNKETPNKDTNTDKKIEPFGLVGVFAAIVAGTIGLFLPISFGITLAVFAFAYGIISLIRINSHPKKYNKKRSRIYAWSSLVSGAIITTIFAAIWFLYY